MKYCAKCGTQLPDETTVCPQCQTQANNQETSISNQQHPQKKKTNKITSLIVTNIILTALTFAMIIVAYFTYPLINNITDDNDDSNFLTSSTDSDDDSNFLTSSTDSDDDSNSLTSSTDSDDDSNSLTSSTDSDDDSNSLTSAANAPCPAHEYGNHDWRRATCNEPAQCYNCDAYKDDVLGQHQFHTNNDGLCDCDYCGMLYDVYMNSIE